MVAPTQRRPATFGLSIKVLALIACFSAGVWAQPVEELYKQCPSGQVAVQHKTRVPESNGCSKPAGISIGGEEDFTSCCDLHDVCYETCSADKQYCESEFSKCLQSLCRTAFAHNKDCPQAAQMYAMGTTMFGSGGFAQSQDEFCECLPLEDVRPHYASLVQRFYQAHAPDKARDWKHDGDGGPWRIDKYLKDFKGKDGGKRSQLARVAKLHYALYKRYPEAILHVGSRKGRTPPRSRGKDEL